MDREGGAGDGGRRKGPAAVTPLPRLRRLGLASRIALDAAQVWVGLKTKRLPDLVGELGRLGGADDPLEPRRLSRIVYRVMNVGPFHPRCLSMSLVLFRALHRQGTRADLVLGLPPEATDHIAHSWVEVDGEVVGPPDGRLGHVEFARYGSAGTASKPPEGR